MKNARTTVLKCKHIAQQAKGKPIDKNNKFKNKIHDG